MATKNKTADDWFAEYAESHQNPTNKLIHWICVPLIMLSILGLFYAIPVSTIIGSVEIKLVHLIIALSLVFYFSLSTRLFMGMLIVTSVMYLVINGIEILDFPLWASCLILFVLAWIGQFYGHKVEGKKPSFLKDVQFLLIGPVWLLHFLYIRWGIRYQ